MKNRIKLEHDVKEFVKYLLDEEAAKDDDIVEGYTGTFLRIIDQYLEEIITEL